MKFKNLVVLSLAVLSFGVCSDIPSCDNEDVKEAIRKNFFKAELEQGISLDELSRYAKLELNSFESELTDEENKTQFCKAKARYLSFANMANDEAPPQWKLIKYSTKYADNKNEVVVEVEWGEER